MITNLVKVVGPFDLPGRSTDRAIVSIKCRDRQIDSVVELFVDGKELQLELYQLIALKEALHAFLNT